MGNARNVGGVRARAGRLRRPSLHLGDDTAKPAHYLTTSQAGTIARAAKARDESRGIFRRWNDRKLTPAETLRATAAVKRRKRQPRRHPERSPALRAKSKDPGQSQRAPAVKVTS